MAPELTNHIQVLYDQDSFLCSSSYMRGHVSLSDLLWASVCKNPQLFIKSHVMFTIITTNLKSQGAYVKHEAYSEGGSMR